MAFEFTEFEYNSNLPIKYVFFEGQADNEHLIVVFSGFGTPGAAYQIAYHYMRTLKDIDCNKLFILDNYGPRGCYYLGEGGTFEVETSVASLITYYINKYDIKLKNTIAAGSSKGGSSALYFGLKYNFGHIIIGAPQIFIGDYVTSTSKETADFMFGVDHGKDIVEKYDRLIPLQLNKEIIPTISILSGKKDVQYDLHVVPLIKMCEQNNIHVDLELVDQINRHGDIPIYYTKFLIDRLVKLFYHIPTPISPMVVEGSTVHFRSFPTEGIINFLFRIEKDEREIFRSDVDASLTLDKPGLYNFFTDIYQKGGRAFTIPYGRTIIGAGYFDYYCNSINIKDGELRFSLDIVEYKPLTYAYYLMKDKTVVQKMPYGIKKELKIKLNDPGNYLIRFYIKTADDMKVVHQSEVRYFCGDKDNSG